MSLGQIPSSNKRTSAEPARKPEPFWQGFAGSWKRLIASPWFWPLLLLAELIVPLFYRQGAVAYNIYVAVLGLVVLLALISIGVMVYTGGQRLKYYLELPQKFSELSAQTLELQRSIPALIDRAQSTMVSQLLTLASLPSSADEIPIVAIAERHGTVHLLLELPAAPEAFVGMRLTVSTKAEGTLWGVVQITHVDDNIGYAAPVDRVNPEFWEYLEERMRTNPSPPRDIVVKTEMHDVLVQLKQVLGEEEVMNNE